MAKEEKKISKVIESFRAELLASGITLSDSQLEVLIKLIKACL